MPDEPAEMVSASRIAFDDLVLYSPVLDGVFDVFLQRIEPGVLDSLEICVPDVGRLMVDVAIDQCGELFFSTQRKRRKHDDVAVSAGGFHVSDDNFHAQLVSEHGSHERQCLHAVRIHAVTTSPCCRCDSRG